MAMSTVGDTVGKLPTDPDKIVDFLEKSLEGSWRNVTRKAAAPSFAVDANMITSAEALKVGPNSIYSAGPFWLHDTNCSVRNFPNSTWRARARPF